MDQGKARLCQCFCFIKLECFTLHFSDTHTNMKMHAQIQRGGGRDPHLKNHKNIGFIGILVRTPETSQSYQTSFQCWTDIDTSVKSCQCWSLYDKTFWIRAWNALSQRCWTGKSKQKPSAEMSQLYNSWWKRHSILKKLWIVCFIQFFLPVE